MFGDSAMAQSTRRKAWGICDPLVGSRGLGFTLGCHQRCCGQACWRRGRDCARLALHPRAAHPSAHSASGTPDLKTIQRPTGRPPDRRLSNRFSSLLSPPIKKTAQGPSFHYWRRGRDSNPRYGFHRTHAFQACDLNHSSTSPEAAILSDRCGATAERRWRERDSNPRYGFYLAQAFPRDDRLEVRIDHAEIMRRR